MDERATLIVTGNRPATLTGRAEAESICALIAIDLKRGNRTSRIADHQVEGVEFLRTVATDHLRAAAYSLVLANQKRVNGFKGRSDRQGNERVWHLFDTESVKRLYRGRRASGDERIGRANGRKVGS